VHDIIRIKTPFPAAAHARIYIISYLYYIHRIQCSLFAAGCIGAVFLGNIITIILYYIIMHRIHAARIYSCIYTLCPYNNIRISVCVCVCVTRTLLLLLLYIYTPIHYKPHTAHASRPPTGSIRFIIFLYSPARRVFGLHRIYYMFRNA